MRQVDYKLSKYVFFLNLRDGSAVCQIRNGAIVKLALACAKRIQNGDLSHLSKSSLNILIKHQIVIPAKTAEREELVVDFMRRKHKSTALCFTLSLGYGCNCACSSCFQNEYPKDVHMTDETVQKVIDFILELAQKKRPPAIAIWYYGGEPLTYTQSGEQLSYIIKSKCNDIGINVYQYMATNGTLLSQRSSRAMLSSLDQFHLTVSQSKQAHGRERPYRSGANSYSDVVKGVGLLAELKKRISLRINVSNVDTLEMDLIVLLKDLAKACGGPYRGMVIQLHQHLREGALCRGNTEAARFSKDIYTHISSVVRKCMPRLDWGPENFLLHGTSQVLYSQGRCLGELCGYIRGSKFFVAPSGDLYLCNITENEPRYLLGNVRNPQEALSNKVYLRALTFLLADRPECKSCEFLPLCITTCSINILEFGMPSRTSCRKKQQDKVVEYILRVTSKSTEVVDKNIARFTHEPQE